jgi:flavorubredoxin
MASSSSRTPTTGELGVSVGEHERRISEAEDDISETRKGVLNVERMIVAMNSNLQSQLHTINTSLSSVKDSSATGKRLFWGVIGSVGGLLLLKAWEVFIAINPGHSP